MKSKSPWVSLCALIASVGLGWLTTPLDAILPNEAKIITGVASILVGIAGFLKMYYDLQNSPAPGLKDPGLYGNIPVVNELGTVLASVVTNTSTVPIVAQLKGKNS